MTEQNQWGGYGAGRPQDAGDLTESEVTLGETIVVFTAGLGVWLLIGGARREGKR